MMLDELESLLASVKDMGLQCFDAWRFLGSWELPVFRGWRSCSVKGQSLSSSDWAQGVTWPSELPDQLTLLQNTKIQHMPQLARHSIS